MGRGILKGLLKSLGETAAKLPEKRKDSNALVYGIPDALKSTLAVFYFLHPSLLNFQQEMRRKMKRDNLETLFEVKNIPCTEQIKNIVDEVEPADLSEIFDKALVIADEQNVLEQYRVLDGGVLIPMDGVWYHASEHIHCDHCLHKTKGEKTVYYHSMIGTALVKPGSTVVLPLMPEYIRNEDGQEKQDCERTATKRYLGERGERLKWRRPEV
jgi:hypothetical protein